MQIRLVLAFAVLLAGCQSTTNRLPTIPAPTTPTTPQTAEEAPAPAAGSGVPREAARQYPATDENVGTNRIRLNQSRQKIVDKWQDKTFADFMETVPREAGSGNFIVNGDIAISDPKRLQEFFEKEVQESSSSTQLVVHAPGGTPAVWSASDKRNLTYCISDDFGANKSRVVTDMAAAASAWEQQGDVAFIYDALQDSNCTAVNAQVVFDIRPVNGESYLARAFFPDDSRGNRNVLINSTAFNTTGNLTLRGILRHELGHTLGFRHEHTRPEAGTCFEDSEWLPLTNYDAFSVMHYPQCNGQGDWSLNLSDLDKQGICKQYGAGPAYDGANPSACLQQTPTPTPTPTPTCGPMVVVESGSVARDQEVGFGPFSVTPGSEFSVTMTGSGDPDLYVRFVVAPTEVEYSCRPYLTGANEQCLLTVPANQTQAFVMVRGYQAGQYQLEIEHTPTP